MPRLAALLLLAAACGAGPSSAPPDLSVGDAAGADLDPGDAAAPPDLAGADLTLPACAPPASPTRGAAWVRDHAPFVAALAVSMGAPPTAAVDAYFDDFHATAVHTWASGLPSEIAAWSAAGHAGFRYVSWVQADGTSTTNGQPLGGAAPLAGRIGYQIGDEPQDQATLTTMLAAAHAIRTSDPDALTIINVNDGDQVDALRPLAIGSDDVDVLSYDHYTYRRSSYAGLAKIRDAARAVGKPYWRYTRAYHDASESFTFTEADLRWDAFVGVVFGFSGLTWFVYNIEPSNPDLVPLLFSTKGDWASPTTGAYDVVKGLNAQLVQLGRTTALLRSVDVRYVSTIGLLNPGLPEWQQGAGMDPYLVALGPSGGKDAVVGFFRDDCDEPYVILQNAAHPGAEFPNGSGDPAAFHVGLDFSSAPAALDTGSLLTLDPTTGATTTIALSGAGAQRSVELTIPAGGVVLWKYADGRPIVRQP